MFALAWVVGGLACALNDGGVETPLAPSAVFGEAIGWLRPQRIPRIWVYCRGWWLTWVFVVMADDAALIGGEAGLGKPPCCL